MEMGAALLPSLTANIVVGNSLLTLDTDELLPVDDLTSLKPLDFRRAFASVFQQGGFDLVVGNPPYIKEYVNKQAFDHVRSSPYYQGKMDIWYMFASRGIDLLKRNSGTLVFIATNNWVTNAGATKLREKIAREAVILELIDFGDFKVFRDAAIQTMILILRKEMPPNEYAFDYRKLAGSDRTLEEAQQLLERKSGEGLLYLTPSLKRDRVPSSPLTFAQSHLETILSKVERASDFRLSKEDMTQGIVAPQDSLSSAAALKLGQGYRNGEGIFVLSNSDAKRLKLSHHEKALLKPYYTTKELRRYFGNSKNQFWIIYTDSRFKNWRAMTTYPLLRAHLDRFKKVITSHNRPYGLAQRALFHGRKNHCTEKGP
jgi:adenine-specific DNA-methyltransferase